MEQMLIRVLNMSLTAGIVILAVMSARLMLRRAPKIFSYVLWLAVLVALGRAVMAGAERKLAVQ